MFNERGPATRNSLIKKNACGFTYFQNKNVPAIFGSTEAEVSISIKETKHLEFQTFQVVTTFTKSQVFLQAYEAE